MIFLYKKNTNCCFTSQIINNVTECREANYTWVNSKINFDHVGYAYLALFQVVSLLHYINVN